MRGGGGHGEGNEQVPGNEKNLLGDLLGDLDSSFGKPGNGMAR